MKEIVRVTIPGTPVAKARHRMVLARNGKTLAYTVRQMVEAEENFRKHLMVALRDWQGAKHPYMVYLWFYFPLTGKHKDYDPYIAKPDADNLEKLVFDALRPWLNDEWIFFHHTVKFYGEEPQTVIEIWELE